MSGVLFLGPAPAWADAATESLPDAGALPVAALRQGPALAGMPPGGTPTRVMPDDGALDAPAGRGSATDPGAPALAELPDVPALPVLPGVPNVAGLPAVPASAPTVTPTAGIGAVSAPPPADLLASPTASARPTPRPAFAAMPKPLRILDDPRLLEEPVDGYVNREKWKK
ncbi:hypothetical protein [Actinoplanes philippinensis]|uniref:hypothetical protein n=1 Tax=Actinoplanes philippinensis TaxID=35752 RepID=UPI000B895C15|nr:hypothetical protein [Actinoplanes philippinensis]